MTNERDPSKIIGFKHGHVRLLEHDDLLTGSLISKVTDYYPQISYLDDPTLEINKFDARGSLSGS